MCQHFRPTSTFFPAPINQWTDLSPQSASFIPYSGVYPTTVPSFIHLRLRTTDNTFLNLKKKKKKKGKNSQIWVKRLIPLPLDWEISRLRCEIWGLGRGTKTWFWWCQSSSRVRRDPRASRQIYCSRHLWRRQGIISKTFLRKLCREEFLCVAKNSTPSMG